MKRFHLLIVFFLVLLVGGVLLLSEYLGQSPDPLIVLEQAIAAHGGEKEIDKPRIGILRATSKGDAGDSEIEELFDLPGRWRKKMVSTKEGRKHTSFGLVFDDQAWKWELGGKAKKVDRGQVASLADFSILLDLHQMDIKLESLRQTRVQGESASGFRAHWGDGTVDYYFDKKVGLLAQNIATVRSDRMKGPLEVRTAFSDYRDLDGVKFPYRRTSYVSPKESPKLVVVTEMVITEVRFLDAVPRGAFDIPPE